MTKLDDEPLSLQDLVVTPARKKVRELAEKVQEEQEKPEFHAHVFWRVELGQESVEELLKDYA